MPKKEYSAGMTKFSFWFSEFKKVVQLQDSGKSLDDIKQMNLAENIFSATTPKRASQIFNAVSTRIKSLDPSFYNFFCLEKSGLLEIVEYKNDILPEIIDRAIKRKKPFVENRNEFRDAIIWLIHAKKIKVRLFMCVVSKNSIRNN